MKTLYLIRGVSGSGKTTLAKQLCQLPNTVSIAADDFWYTLGSGEYTFDVNRLGEAHSWCQESVVDLMKNLFNIVVHNTFTTEKELLPYTEMAEKFGYRVVSLVVENRHGNGSVHNVPEKTLEKQKQRLKGVLSYD